MGFAICWVAACLVLGSRHTLSAAWQHDIGTSEPAYMAEQHVEVPRSTIFVLLQPPPAPILGVTSPLSIGRVSFIPKAFSQQSSCPQAPLNLISVSENVTIAGGHSIGVGSGS